MDVLAEIVLLFPNLRSVEDRIYDGWLCNVYSPKTNTGYQLLQLIIVQNQTPITFQHCPYFRVPEQTKMQGQLPYTVKLMHIYHPGCSLKHDTVT